MALTAQEEAILKAVAVREDLKAQIEALIVQRDAAQQKCEADKQAAFLKDVKPLEDQIGQLRAQLP